MVSEVMLEASRSYYCTQKLGYDHLKDKQMKVIKEFVRGKYNFRLLVRNLGGIYDI